MISRFNFSPLLLSAALFFASVSFASAQLEYFNPTTEYTIRSGGGESSSTINEEVDSVPEAVVVPDQSEISLDRVILGHPELVPQEMTGQAGSNTQDADLHQHDSAKDLSWFSQYIGNPLSQAFQQKD